MVNKKQLTRLTTEREQMAQPADTLRDGAIKATIWANASDKGTFYSVDLVRSYQDKQTGEWKDVTSFTGADALRASNLMALAYNRTLELKANDKQQST